MSETDDVTQPLRNALGRMKNGRILRMNNGAAKTPDGRKIVFGVSGYPDLGGLISLSAPCASCGHVPAPVGRWAGIETKTDVGRLNDDQKAFHAMVRKYNGLIEVARTVEEGIEIARRWGAIL